MAQEVKKNNKEVRLASINDFSIERREEEGKGSKMIIEGYASIFDSETLIGDESWGFYERVEQGAFDGADMRDVPLKYNHSDAVPILARTRNKSLTLSVDEKGLKVHAELLDTQDGADMYKRIKAGLIDKMSFAFTVAEEAVDWIKGEEIPHRRIKKFDRIFDVSVVDVPAYDDTSIYARSKDLAEAWERPVETEEPSKQEARNYALEILLKKYGGQRK